MTGGQDSVGLRMPSHPVAQALLRAFAPFGGQPCPRGAVGEPVRAHLADHRAARRRRSDRVVADRRRRRVRRRHREHDRRVRRRRAGAAAGRAASAGHRARARTRWCRVRRRCAARVGARSRRTTRRRPHASCRRTPAAEVAALPAVVSRCSRARCPHPRRSPACGSRGQQPEGWTAHDLYAHLRARCERRSTRS